VIVVLTILCTYAKGKGWWETLPIRPPWRAENIGAVEQWGKGISIGRVTAATSRLTPVSASYRVGCTRKLDPGEVLEAGQSSSASTTYAYLSLCATPTPFDRTNGDKHGRDTDEEPLVDDTIGGDNLALGGGNWELGGDRWIPSNSYAP